MAYEGMEQFFPKEKIILTGNPVRQDIANVESKRKEAQQFFDLDPNKKTVLVIGGSLGARTINLSMAQGLDALAKNGLQLIWQTGKAFFDTAQEKTKAYSFPFPSA